MQKKVYARAGGGGEGTPWARKTKKVQKPPGEIGRIIRKSKMLLGPQIK